MPSSRVLRHRGIEAWLEDSNGWPIALSEDHKIDLHTISTWVNVKPRQFYTLRWRTGAGRSPRSALCEVYVEGGFHSASDDLESSELVSTSIMDASRRITQSKTTKGWLNPPYSRFGCLRVRRRIHTDRDSTEEATKTQSEILLLGSVRLEMRRISGHIRKNQVYWGEGDYDDDNGIHVFNPDGIKVIDDAAREKSPYITFEFNFREDPKITKTINQLKKEISTQNKKEESEETEMGICVTPVTQKSSKSHTSGLPVTGRAEDIVSSMGPSTHTSSQDSQPPSFLPDKAAQRMRGKVDKIGGNHLSKNGIPDVTPSIGPSKHTSLPPPIPRGKIVSNTNLFAPDTSGPNVEVATSQKIFEVAHPPSSPTTTEEVFHAETILNTESVMPTSKPSPAPLRRTTTVNPATIMQKGPSDSLIPIREPSPKITTNPGTQTPVGHSDGEFDGRCLGVQTPLTEMTPRINEVQQSSEGSDRDLVTAPASNTSSEIVNAGQDISSTSRKGKRKMDQGDDSTNAHVPVGDGIKRNCIMTVEEEDSDIVYIGSWRPITGKTHIKFENLVSNSVPLTTAVKTEQLEIKLEDDKKKSINEMMGNYDALEHRKEELKKKLAVKMEAQQREIDELLRRLDD